MRHVKNNMKLFLRHRYPSRNLRDISCPICDMYVVPVIVYEEKKYMEQQTSEEIRYFVSPEEREHLVRLCAAITHDRDAAEDLAQETLLEAWRNAHKLHDPAGADRWLAAIARNVCRRSARRQGRNPAVRGEVDV